MPRSSPPSLSILGVLAGFVTAFFLFARREKKPQMDEAEVLLQHAQQQMKEAQAKNRDRAVQAITQKNNLQALVDQTQRMVDQLEARAQTAHEQGDVERGTELRAEQRKYRETLAQTHASLQNAIATTEAVKTAMRREEERVRTLTAQALSLRATGKQAQIEMAVEQSRLAMTTSHAAELFGRAQAKIQQTQTRTRLMTQIRETIETLEAAAEVSGDEALRQRLLEQSEGLKSTALDPRLGL